MTSTYKVLECESIYDLNKTISEFSFNHILKTGTKIVSVFTSKDCRPTWDLNETYQIIIEEIK